MNYDGLCDGERSSIRNLVYAFGQMQETSQVPVLTAPLVRDSYNIERFIRHQAPVC